MFPKTLYRNRTVYDGVTTAAVARIETDERFVRSEGEQIRAKAEGWVELSDLNQPVSWMLFRARAADAQRAEASPDRTWSEYVETRTVRSDGEKTLEGEKTLAKAEGWVEDLQVAIDAAKRADRVALAAATRAQREQQDQARHAADQHNADLIEQAVLKALDRRHERPTTNVGTDITTPPTSTPNAAVRSILGRNVEKFRNECGWTFEVMADITGISKDAINEIINHDTRPHVTTLKAIADAFSEALDDDTITVAALNRELTETRLKPD